MITSICKFPLLPGLKRDVAVEDIKTTIPAYQGRPGLIRKYVCLNLDEGHGCGIYLWTDRESADSYFADSIPMMEKQLGTRPEVVFFDTPVIMDNASDEVIVNE